MGLNRQRTLGYVPASLPKVCEVFGMHRELVYRDVVWGILGVCPFEYGIPAGVKDVLGVRSGKIGSQGDIERVMDVCIRWRDSRYRSHALSRDVPARIHGGHAHIRPRHAEVGTHPLGPMTHINGELIHD